MNDLALGIDPSLTCTGLAKVDLESGLVVDSGVIETKPKDAHIVRARIIHAALVEWTKDARTICMEIPHGSLSSKAAIASGICIGLMAGIGNNPHVEVHIIKPRQVKTVLPGNVPKEEFKTRMVEWAKEKHPEMDWNLPKTKVHNIADALAVLHATLVLGKGSLLE